MRRALIPIPVAFAGLLAACGNGHAPPSEPRNASAAAAPAAGQVGQVHNGEGDVTEVTKDAIAISHGPIVSAGWPAMTMTFKASPDMARSVNLGDPVSFSFTERNGSYMLTSIHKTR